jgi:hypothetical protein
MHSNPWHYVRGVWSAVGRLGGCHRYSGHGEEKNSNISNEI